MFKIFYVLMVLFTLGIQTDWLLDTLIEKTSKFEKLFVISYTFIGIIFIWPVMLGYRLERFSNNFLSAINRMIR